MRNIKFYWAISIVLMLISCGSSQPRLHLLAPGDVILALGDSITFGVGATPDTSYPSVLARLTGYKVINAGVPGEETSGTLLRLNELLEKEQPALVIVCLGGNDIIHKVPDEQIKANLQKIIRIIRQHHAQVVLIGVPKFGLMLSSAEFYQALGEEEKVVVDTSILPNLEGSAQYKSDYVHLNAAGYQLLAEAIAKLLQERGAFRSL